MSFSPINKQLALEALGDDESLYQEIAAVFLEDSPNQLRQFNEGVLSGDVNIAIIAVHSLKSAAGVVGATEVQKLSAAVEALLRKGEVEKGFSHLNELRELLTVAREELNNLTNKAEPQSVSAAISIPNAAAKSILGPLDILLVDDDQTARTNISGLLRSLGADESKLTICATYLAANKAIKNQVFDLLIVDYFLDGGHSGLEILNDVQAAGLLAPVIILTGNDEQDVDVKLLQAGAADYLMKSELRPKLLERSLRYALERAKRQTELVKIEQLERERTSLRNSIRGLEKVLSVVGHELRTPIASTRLTLEWMLMESDMERPIVEENLSATLKEVIRLSNLVTDLIDVTKLNSGVNEWDWEEISFDSVCQSALDANSAAIANKQLKFDVSIKPLSLSMKGDGSAVSRILQNLISNSIKSADEGRISISVEESVIQDEAYILMTVSDTGSGIPPEKLSKLGEAFTLSAGAVGGNYITGSGFGLAIVKPIVAAHGGKIEFTSTLGRGTTVKVLLRKDLKSPVSANREA